MNMSTLQTGVKILGGVAVGALVGGLASIAGPVVGGSGFLNTAISKGLPLAAAVAGLSVSRKHPVFGPAVAAGGIAALAFAPIQTFAQGLAAKTLFSTNASSKPSVSGYAPLPGPLSGYAPLPGPLSGYNALPGPLGTVVTDLGTVVTDMGTVVTDMGAPYGLGTGYGY